jgi:hypothetical protein
MNDDTSSRSTPPNEEVISTLFAASAIVRRGQWTERGSHSEALELETVEHKWASIAARRRTQVRRFVASSLLHAAVSDETAARDSRRYSDEEVSMARLQIWHFAFHGRRDFAYCDQQKRKCGMCIAVLTAGIAKEICKQRYSFRVYDCIRWRRTVN